MPIGDGLGWNINAPADTDLRSVGAAEIRDVRTGVGIRIDKEHETLDAGDPPDEGGEHRSGSAKAYYETPAPTDRPDPTSVVLASPDDDGRIWIDSDTGWAFYWADDDWRVMGVHTVEGSLDSGEISDFNDRIIITIDPGFVTNQFFLLVESANGEVLPTYSLLVADATQRKIRFPRDTSNSEHVLISRSSQVISILKPLGTDLVTITEADWVAQRWFVPAP